MKYSLFYLTTFISLNCSVSLACPEDDSFEENDTSQTAADLEELLYENLYLCSQDEDWFLINAQEGFLLQAEVLFSHDLSDIDIELYSLELELQGRSESINDNEILTVLGTDTHYLLRVYDYIFDTGSAPYQIQISYMEPPNCEYDSYLGNNSFQESVVPSAPEFSSQVCAFDEDWFSFSILEAEEFVFTLTSQIEDGVIEAYIYDSQQQLLEMFMQEAEGVYTSSYLSDSDREIYLRIKEAHDNGGEYGVEYTLTKESTQYQSCVDDNSGGSEQDPERLVTDAYTLTICEKEWYQIELAANEEIEMTLSHPSEDGTLYSELFVEGVRIKEETSHTFDFSYTALEDMVLILSLDIKEDRRDLGITVSLDISNTIPISEPESQPSSPTAEPSQEIEDKNTGCGGGAMLLFFMPLFSFFREKKHHPS